MFSRKSRISSELFCLLSFSFLIIISHASDQIDNVTSERQQQQSSNKINSVNVNNESVTTAQTALPSSKSDSVAYKQKYSNLNKKYEIQSTVTSSPSIGLYPGPKKSECVHLLNWMGIKLLKLLNKNLNFF